MSNTEMNIFKDEILKKIREIETKFSKELSKKNLDININYENFNEKVTSILESNRLMIASITNQKLHFEKINKLEADTKKMSETLTTHEIRINNSLNEIKKMKFNYDKIISENLIIPAYIGPGSLYKSLGDFIINTIEEFKKFKEEKEHIRQSNNELKIKFDSMIKNMTSFVELNSSRSKAYADSKEKEYQLMIDAKLQKIDEKSIETNQHIYTNQIKFEEKLKEIGEKISVLTKDKNDTNSILKDKLEEIKEKEEEMDEKLQKAIKEVIELKRIKTELSEEMKSIYLKIEDLNKKTKLKVQDNKTNSNIFNINKKNNLNSFGNVIYNTNNNNNNIIKLNKEKKKEKISDLPNLSNINNLMTSNNIINKENKIFRNEKRESINDIDSRTEEEYKQIKTKPNIKEDKNTIENIFKKSTNNLTIRDLENRNFEINKNAIKIENNYLSPKPLGNNKMKIKEKLNEKSTYNLKFDSKENKKKYIFDTEIKDNYLDNLDKQKKKNVEFNNSKYKQIKYEYENLGKTGIEFYRNAINLNRKQNTSKAYKSFHKNDQNILIQINKVDKNLQSTKSELLNEKNEYITNLNNNLNIKNSPKKDTAIECNVINLNLLDLPDNKKENSTFYNDRQNSFELKNQNKKLSINDSNNKIRPTPLFGKTYNEFYKTKGNKKIFNGNQK